MGCKLFSLVFALVSIVVCRAQSACTVAAPCTTVPTAPNVPMPLKWGASSTANVSYAIYRSPASTVSYVRIDSGGIIATNYIDATVVNGQTYNYFVEAYNVNGFSAPSNIATAVAVFGSPTNLTTGP